MEDVPVEVNIPIVVAFEPQELGVVIGALELAPLPYRATSPILKKIGVTAAEQVAAYKAIKEKQNGQRSDNGGATDGRGKGASGEAVPTVPG